MNNKWISAVERPDADGEYHVLSEVTEEYCGHEKGQIILQTDTYNAEHDLFMYSDDDHLRIICWHEMLYPEVPEEYRGKNHIIYRVIARVE